MKTRSGFWFVAPFFALYLVFLVVPLAMGFKYSLTNKSLGGNNDGYLGLANYVELFGDPAVWNALWNTLLFTLVSTPVLALLGLGMALLTNRAMPARWLYRLAFFGPFVLPVSVVVLIWDWLYQPAFGLINDLLTRLGLGTVGWLSSDGLAMTSIIIATVWWTVGFNYLLYLAGLQDIPREMYEVSAIDGATPWQQLRRITVPMLRDTHQLVVVLQILASLKVFDQIYLLTGQGGMPGVRSIVQYIYESGFTKFRIGYASAISYVFFALIAVAALAQFKFFSRRRELR
ncbi:MAG: sugar ABC transporter permease [Kutzneria sp.]|nr:sugar ABC transporter permease [Kutzneria sp.]MBV9847286.1 sugar ABC transporter permease [Kutzneria sp.]